MRQASAWPVPSDAGLPPLHGPPPFRVVTDGTRLLKRSRSIRKMHYPPFTQGLRPGLLAVVSTSVLEVLHDQV